MQFISNNDRGCIFLSKNNRKRCSHVSISLIYQYSCQLLYMGSLTLCQLVCSYPDHLYLRLLLCKEPQYLHLHIFFINSWSMYYCIHYHKCSLNWSLTSPRRFTDRAQIVTLKTDISKPNYVHLINTWLTHGQEYICHFWGKFHFWAIIYIPTDLRPEYCICVTKKMSQGQIHQGIP